MSGGYEIRLDPKNFDIVVVEKWCIENVGEGNYNLMKNYYSFSLILDEDSAMAFRLTFG